MGSWAEVYCDCLNRVRLPQSHYHFDRPHYKKSQLTKREREEIEEWKQTTRDMFQCGHRNGMALEVGPGDIMLLGKLIGSIFRHDHGAFEVFIKVGDWRCYEDELLLIQPDEAALWKMEVEELQRAFSGLNNLPNGKIEKLIVEFFRTNLGGTIALEARIDEAADRMSASVVANLKRNVQGSRLSDLEEATQKILLALKGTAELCAASIRTGNPIRMLW